MTPYTWEGPSGGFPGADARLQLDVSQVPARPGPPPLGGVCPSLGLCPVSLVGVGWGVTQAALGPQWVTGGPRSAGAWAWSRRKTA